MHGSLCAGRAVQRCVFAGDVTGAKCIALGAVHDKRAGVPSVRRERATKERAAGALRMRAGRVPTVPGIRS